MMQFDLLYLLMLSSIITKFSLQNNYFNRANTFHIRFLSGNFNLSLALVFNHILVSLTKKLPATFSLKHLQ